MEQLLATIDDVIQSITTDPNRDRIQKLMVYACSQVWADEASESSDLGSLISQLLTQYPTLEDVQGCLYHRVGTLNKTAEYTLIADTLLAYLVPLYAQYQAADETIALDYDSVAQHLHNDPDILRIKKLLFCACGNSWQNDTSVLEQLDTISLVSQMRYIAPSMATLTAILSSIVATLNRTQAYEAIAGRLVTTLAPLYEEMAETAMTEVSAAEVAATEVLERPTEAPTDATFPLPQGGNLPGSSPSEHSALTVSVLAKRLPRVQLDLTDLYDLRLEVMKYTTPLRAKILLFATLRQHTEWSAQDYMMLKKTTLSALLRETFQTYKHLEHLQPCLRDTAAQLNPASDYRQTYSAILRAMTPWYETGHESQDSSPELIDRVTLESTTSTSFELNSTQLD